MDIGAWNRALRPRASGLHAGFTLSRAHASFVDEELSRRPVCACASDGEVELEERNARALPPPSAACLRRPKLSFAMKTAASEEEKAAKSSVSTSSATIAATRAAYEMNLEMTQTRPRGVKHKV